MRATVVRVDGKGALIPLPRAASFEVAGDQPRRRKERATDPNYRKMTGPLGVRHHRRKRTNTLRQPALMKLGCGGHPLDVGGTPEIVLRPRERSSTQRQGGCLREMHCLVMDVRIHRHAFLLEAGIVDRPLEREHLGHGVERALGLLAGSDVGKRVVNQQAAPQSGSGRGPEAHQRTRGDGSNLAVARVPHERPCEPHTGKDHHGRVAELVVQIDRLLQRNHPLARAREREEYAATLDQHGRNRRIALSLPQRQRVVEVRERLLEPPPSPRLCPLQSSITRGLLESQRRSLYRYAMCIGGLLAEAEYTRSIASGSAHAAAGGEGRDRFPQRWRNELCGSVTGLQSLRAATSSFAPRLPRIAPTLQSSQRYSIASSTRKLRHAESSPVVSTRARLGQRCRLRQSQRTPGRVLRATAFQSFRRSRFLRKLASRRC